MPATTERRTAGFAGEHARIFVRPCPAWGTRLAAVALLLILLAPEVAGRVEASERYGGSHLPVAARRYMDRLASLPPAPIPVEVESLFVLAAAAANAMTETPPLGGPNTVEAMDDSAAALARRLLPGITIIHSDEGNGAVPDDSFFLDLSGRRGRRADVEFFRLRAATTDEGGTPRWTEMTYDYGGCTKFGSGALVGAWAAWNAYATKFPGPYAPAVSEALDACRRELLEGECVCGAREDLLRELRLFVRRFPKDGLVLPVRARIEAVEGSTVPIRYGCRPG